MQHVQPADDQAARSSREGGMMAQQGGPINNSFLFSLFGIWLTFEVHFFDQQL